MLMTRGAPLSRRCGSAARVQRICENSLVSMSVRQSSSVSVANWPGLAHQLTGDCLADALGAAGDDRAAPGQPEFHLCLTGLPAPGLLSGPLLCCLRLRQFEQALARRAE